MKKNIKKENATTKTIYYDSSCFMCTAIIEKIDKTPKKESFNIKDITKDSLPDNLTKRAVEKEIHVIGPEGKIYKNAEGILKILEEYPQWEFIAKVCQLPIMKQLSQLVYAFIAANRHYFFGPENRIFYLKLTLSASTVAAVLLTTKLWAGTRFFPSAPFLRHLQPIPYPFDLLMLLSLLSLLLLIFFSPKPRKAILGVIVILTIFAFFDQMRWPISYYYGTMFATLALYAWRPPDAERREKVLNVYRLIVACIYFYSGVQKINLNFPTEVFPWMIEPITALLPDSLKDFPLMFGLLAPFIEAGVGIGLLTQKYRKYAVYLALGMHLFILSMLGPFGHNWNSAVWPWNIAMALYVVILFWRTENFSFRTVLWAKNFLSQKFIFVFFVIMPVLGYFQKWDAYLSSSHYTGNVNTAVIHLNDSTKRNLPKEIAQYAKKIGGNNNSLDILQWAFGELNVPPYPETRVYKTIARKICDYGNNTNDIELLIYEKQLFIQSNHPSTYSCSAL